MTDRKIYLQKQLEDLKVHPSDAQLDQFILFYEMLIEKNQVMNLTRITEFEDVVLKHFADSLSIMSALDMKPIKKIIDVGTGGGFPGLPLKIMNPDIEVLMVDSVGKKIRFVEEVIEKLQIDGATAKHVRIEDLAREKGFREKYDLCVSRAVANLATLSEYCLPMVRVGGKFVAYKTTENMDEIETAGKAIHTLGGKPPVLNEVTVGDMQRCLVTVTKTKKTPMQYPRKAGTAAKNPII